MDSIGYKKKSKYFSIELFFAVTAVKPLAT